VDPDDEYSKEYLVLTAEPGGKSTEVYVYYIDPSSYNWAGQYLSFSEVLGRECEVSSDEVDSDFSLWSPGFPDLFPDEQQMCLLGQHTAYERRKPCKLCKVGVGYGIVAADSHPCNCTQFDFAW